MLNRQNYLNQQDTSEIYNLIQANKRVTVTDARNTLGDIVDSVRYQGSSVLLEKSGKPVAVVVSVDAFVKWQQQRTKDFEVIERIQKRFEGQFTEEEAMALALEAQREVRKQAR